jgi:hypothetical protein
LAKTVSIRSLRLLLLFQRSVVTILMLSLGIYGYPAEAFAAQDAAAPQIGTSPENLDHLLAPIALYPDALLMQVLAASVNSQEVLDAGNWLLDNKSLQGTQIDDAAKKLGFGAATIALLHFPEVVDMMCTQLDWTKQVGLAFTADQAGVLASVQRLRAQAVQYGNLKSSQQQQVVTQTDNGKQVIVIQPANPQVVYVPQYNPQTVYVQSGPSTGDVVAASIISFGLGVAVGAMFSNNNYYYPRWGYGGVYYGGRPWVPRGYVYRPVYGPGWRPPAYYRPPANYPYHRPVHYNNNYWSNYRGGNNSYRGGNNTVNINNTNNINVNRPGGNNGYNKPGNGNNNNNNRPNNGNNGGYNKPGNGNNNNNRPGGNNNAGNGNNNSRPSGNNGGTPGYNKPGNGGNAGINRPGNGNSLPPTGGATTRPAPDRGYAKPAAGVQPPRPAAGGNQTRPGGNQAQTRPAPQSRPAPQARPAPAQNRPAPAFGGGGSGKSASAASQRGAASNAGRKK